MKIDWYVKEGYIYNGTHSVEIDDDDLADCEDNTERQILIKNHVAEAFKKEVTYQYERPELRGIQRGHRDKR